ncbi:MAG: hypothetical protein H7X93_03965 [Sphingomonadaceae bacterium]|nr:hypothetical protein [Sphingomonadaceae bacterium]
MRKHLAFAVILLAPACGAREDLRPAVGESMPVAPAMAAEAPTTEELLAPTTEQRPTRVDEVFRRSEERQDDRFDLPPPG